MKKLMVLASVLLVTACGVSKSDGVISRDKNSGGFAGLTTLSDIEVSGDSALKGTNEVVIGSFKVGFVESGVQKRKAGGGFLGSGGFGNAKGKLKLEGVSESLKKQITEAAYADFKTQLKTNGFNVVSSSTFRNSESYKGASKYDFPYEADDSGFLSEYGVSKFYQPAEFGSQGILLANDIQGVSGGFGFGNGSTAAAEYAAANNLAVISGTYLIDFATAGGHGGSWSSSASVQVGQNLSVTSGSVKFVTGGTSSFTNGTADLTIGQPIESGKEFGEVIDSTSDTEVVVQETLNVLTAVLSGGTNRSKNYTVKANPTKFKTQSVDILKQANKAITLQAAKLR